MTLEEFEQIVEEERLALPREFADLLDLHNVAIMVDDWPLPEILRTAGIRNPSSLFGFYSGIPLPDRGADKPLLPDRIWIFREPILRAFSTDAQIRAEIRTTLRHEIAHFFGFSDEHLLREGTY